MQKYFFPSGFTVIEILVVIAIITILSSLSLSVFNTFKESIDLAGCSRELVADLRYTQQLAVTEQIRHGIQFLKDEKKYQIIRYGDSEEILKEKQLPVGISYESINGLSLDRARFNPYGATEESGSVVLINTQNNKKTIQIRPSGFVKLY